MNDCSDVALTALLKESDRPREGVFELTPEVKEAPEVNEGKLKRSRIRLRNLSPPSSPDLGVTTPGAAMRGMLLFFRPRIPRNLDAARRDPQSKVAFAESPFLSMTSRVRRIRAWLLTLGSATQTWMRHRVKAPQTQSELLLEESSERDAHMMTPTAMAWCAGSCVSQAWGTGGKVIVRKQEKQPSARVPRDFCSTRIATHDESCLKISHNLV
mmetsp:Transcript_70564/g.166405  ORF Transcript_70564/g.166405 Transcript_70564/m.166405 type:complete len:213 (-) Transcript_70564:511-1149(-)